MVVGVARIFKVFIDHLTKVLYGIFREFTFMVLEKQVPVVIPDCIVSF